MSREAGISGLWGGALAVAWVAVLAGCAGPAAYPTVTRSQAPRNAYVLLSGGGTPLSNNYSQYLQARAVADSFERDQPAAVTWNFFGVGNRDGAAPVLADARREVKRDGRLLQTWVPGVLPRNRPATKESFLRALREEVLPVVQEGGTLFLFVGDHGELVGRGEKRESAITMWQLKRVRRGGWFTDGKEVLGVAELRQTLAAGLGQGRVVFCMTQCHSGGFHDLAVAGQMVPPREWFSRVPDWVPARGTGLRLQAAGFTATDAASIAAGCDANPDPEHWAGYERFLPESLLGRDLLTGAPKGVAAGSLAKAHEAAVLIDQTVDKPRATSEHYLAAWAHLIESRLATTLAVTERTQQAVVAYQRAVDTGRVGAANPALRDRQQQYARFLARMGEQAPEARSLLASGNRRDLEAAIRPQSEDRGGRGGRRGSASELRRAWNDTLRPAWKAAVLAGRIDGLTGAALAFERHLLKLEDDGGNFLFVRGDSDALLNELYWESGYDRPSRLDPARAAAVTRWGVDRRARIIAWGAASADAAIRAAAEKIGYGAPAAAEAPASLSRRTAAERALFYRRVLAAWELLLALDARDALAELQTLIELEQTVLPQRRG